MKNIIIEGCDCTGKTTLQETLFCSSEFTVFNHGPYPGCKSIAQYYEACMIYGMIKGCNIVMDRSWISEPVYGYVMRDGLNRVSQDDAIKLEALASQMETVIIFCIPPYEVVKDEYMKRKEIEYLDNEDQLRDVYKGFIEYVNHYNGILPFIVFDYTKTSYAELTETLEEFK